MPSALEKALAAADRMGAREQKIAARRRYFHKQVTKRKLTKKPKEKKEGWLDRHLPDEDVRRAAGQIKGTLVHTPGAMVELGKAMGQDIVRVPGGKPKPSKTGEIFIESAKQMKDTYSSLENMRRDLGYVIMDVGTLPFAGARAAGTARRVGSTYRATRRGEVPKHKQIKADYEQPERRPDTIKGVPVKVTAGPVLTKTRRSTPSTKKLVEPDEIQVGPGKAPAPVEPHQPPVGESKLQADSKNRDRIHASLAKKWQRKDKDELWQEVTDRDGNTVRVRVVANPKETVVSLWHTEPNVPKDRKRHVPGTERNRIVGDPIAYRPYGKGKDGIAKALEDAQDHIYETKRKRRLGSDFTGTTPKGPAKGVIAPADVGRRVEFDESAFPLRNVPTEELAAKASELPYDAAALEYERLSGRVKGDPDAPEHLMAERFKEPGSYERYLASPEAKAASADRAARRQILENALPAHPKHPKTVKAETQAARVAAQKELQARRAAEGKGGFKAKIEDQIGPVAPAAPAAATKVGKAPVLSPQRTATENLGASLTREQVTAELRRTKANRTRAAKKGGATEWYDKRVARLEHLRSAAMPEGTRGPGVAAIPAEEIARTVPPEVVTKLKAKAPQRTKKKAPQEWEFKAAVVIDGKKSTRTIKATGPAQARNKLKAAGIEGTLKKHPAYEASKAAQAAERKRQREEVERVGEPEVVEPRFEDLEPSPDDLAALEREMAEEAGEAPPVVAAPRVGPAAPAKPKTQRQRKAEQAQAKKAAKEIKAEGGRPTAAAIRDRAGVSHTVANEAARGQRRSVGGEVREERVTKRGSGTTPRELGISQRQIEKSVPKELAHIAPAMSRDLQKLHTEAGKGKQPTWKSISETFQRYLGPELGKRAFTEWRTAKGGAGPQSIATAMRAAIKEAYTPHTGGPVLLGWAVRTRVAKGGSTEGHHDFFRWANSPKGKPTLFDEGMTKNKEIVPIVVHLPANPLARKIMETRYKWMRREDREGIRNFPKVAASLSRRKVYYEMPVEATATRKAKPGKKIVVYPGVQGHIEFQLRELDNLFNSLSEIEKSQDTPLAGFFNAKARKDEVAGAFKQAVAEYKARRAERPIHRESPSEKYLKRPADTINQLATIATLYLKGAYYTANFLGQAFFLMADHYMNPVRVARSAALLHQVRVKYPHLIPHINRMMGVGLTLEIKGGTKGRIGAGTAAVHGVLSRASNRMLDDWWRQMAFVNEARRLNFHNADSIAQLFENPNNKGRLMATAKASKRNMVDYGRMNKRDREILRRIIFFYPWVKGSSLYTLRFAAEHPYQAVILQQTARETEAKYKKILGPMPSYMEGLIPMGQREDAEGNMIPLVINPTAAGVFGSLGEVTSAATAALAGNVLLADQPTQFLSPAVSLPASFVLGQDLFTGQKALPTQSRLGLVAQEAGQLAAPYDLFKNIQKARKRERGELPSKDTLYPYTPGEVVNRYAAGLTPFGMNPKEASSRAYAEQSGLKSKEERVYRRYAEERRDMLEAGRKVGLIREGRLPKPLRDAYDLRAARDANIEAFKAEKGSELTTPERLYADLSLAVRMGKIPEGLGKKLLEDFALRTDVELKMLARKVREVFYAVEIISKYRSAINARLSQQGEPMLSG